jgi:hypothetical protein
MARAGMVTVSGGGNVTPAKRLIMMGAGYKNAVLNPSFENEFTNWAEGGDNGTWSISTNSMHGTKAAKVIYNPGRKRKYQDIVFPNGHKIYVCGWCYIESYTSGDAPRIQAFDYNSYNNAINAIFSIVSLNTYQFRSAIKTAASGGVRLSIGSIVDVTYTANFDAIAAVDLDALGLGDKDLTWCDANIPQNIIW